MAEGGGGIPTISLPMTDGGEVLTELPLLQAISDKTSKNIKMQVSFFFKMVSSLI